MKQPISVEVEPQLAGHSVLPLAEHTVDARMVALMRCLLALSALCIVYIDPPPSGKLLDVAYVSLALYGLYSAVLCGATFHDRRLISERPLYWADVAFYGYLVALTGGVSSIFFHFFFFCILVASFSRGYREGLAVTAVSALLFSIAGFVAYAPGGAFEIDRAVIRPIYLLMLGFMVSYWGGREIMLRRRLELLKEVGTIAFPTFGLDHAVHEYMRRLLSYFDAKTCILVFADTQSSKRVLYRAEAAKPFAIMRAEELADASAAELLALPPTLYATCGLTWPRSPRVIAWDQVRGRHDGAVREQCLLLANLLECASFATVPYKQPRGIVGRLYMLSAMRHYSIGETDFLGQVANQIAVSVNNIMLLDALTHDAALQERSKISRDIHDSTVQSYIGLKLGLEALYRDVATDSRVGSRLKELLDMATLTVDDLRDYIDRLSGQYARRPSVNLIAGVLEQKRRYRDFHGIDIEVRCDEGLQLSDWVAGEAYQIVCEALSNVFRHARAKRVFVSLSALGGALKIEVGNAAADTGTTPFLPRSINERAMSLGGAVEVLLGQGGQDLVRVSIPLSTRARQQ